MSVEVTPSSERAEFMAIYVRTGASLDREVSLGDLGAASRELSAAGDEVRGGSSARGERVSDELDGVDEELLRQLHPAWVQKGVRRTKRSSPLPNFFRLSVDRGSQVGPKESHRRFQFASAGVWA